MPYLAALLLTAGIGWTGFGLDRSIGSHLAVAFALCWSGYGLWYWRGYSSDFRFWFLLGVVLRVGLVVAFPALSDDIYRFIWDGQLIRAGINPFAELPAYYLVPGHEVAGLSQALFERLNSPDYYTIYPPVAQGVFSLAVWISPDSWYGASLVMKTCLLLGELGTAWLLLRILAHYGLPRRRMLLYWLNPLILVEIMGNLHFEGLMVCLLLLSLWAMLQQRWLLAGAAMALSVASKLLPLMLLPFLIKRLLARPESSQQHGTPPGRLGWWRPAMPFGLAFVVVLVLVFLPLLTAGFPENFGSSVDLYFRRFEFNASLYYLARAYGYWEIGWNQIARFGPLLARLAVVAILLFALLERGFRASRWSNTEAWRRLPQAWMWAFCLYLLFATTVHPWYLAVPMVLSVFTPWRFVLLWSMLIGFTYVSYLSDPYRENLWLVALEYIGVLVVLLLETRHRLYRA